MPDESLTIRRPDDWHVHLRDGEMLRGVVGHTARQFARAIVMPNLSPPVTDTAAARAYRERIVAALLPGSDFTPLMTCYLTDTTDADDLSRGFADGVFTASSIPRTPPPIRRMACPMFLRSRRCSTRCNAAACRCWFMAR